MGEEFTLFGYAVCSETDTIVKECNAINIQQTACYPLLLNILLNKRITALTNSHKEATSNLTVTRPSHHAGRQTPIFSMVGH